MTDPTQDNPQSSKVLIVDDEPKGRAVLRDLLKPQGYEISIAENGPDALKIAARDPQPHVILLDVKMPEMDGFEVCERLKQDKTTAHIPVIIVTAHKLEELNIRQGYEVGADDYITKPCQPKEIALLRVKAYLRLQKAIKEKERVEREKAQLEAENIHLREEIKRQHGFRPIIGQSNAHTELLRQVKQVSPTNTTVLITGETGTGKELVSREIHFGSPRAKQSFIPINCAAIPESLLESELFGYAPNSGIAGADPRGKKGLFELADKGTLFLDEIGAVSQRIAEKLLRLLEDQQVWRLSATKPNSVNVRIVAATNRDLWTMAEEGEFMADLYFRLARFTVEVPPLRQRQEDIPLLADHFLRMFASEMGIKEARLSAQAHSALKGYHFPGNVRELKNMIEGALIRSGGVIRPEDLQFIDVNSASKTQATTSQSASTPQSNNEDPQNREETPLQHSRVESLQPWQLDYLDNLCKRIKPNALRQAILDRVHYIGKITRADIIDLITIDENKAMGLTDQEKRKRKRDTAGACLKSMQKVSTVAFACQSDLDTLERHRDDLDNGVVPAVVKADIATRRKRESTRVQISKRIEAHGNIRWMITSDQEDYVIWYEFNDIKKRYELNVYSSWLRRVGGRNRRDTGWTVP